jgi:hypothetical protein
VLASEQHRAGSLDELAGDRDAKLDADHDLAVQLLAGSQGKDAHELRGRSYVEDELIAALDRPTNAASEQISPRLLPILDHEAT